MLLLPASVTVADATDTRRLMLQALKAEPRGEVVVDASNLRQFDSSALAVLLECRRAAEAAGQPLSVRNAPPKLAALAQLYGVGPLLLAGSGSAQAAP
jgi:phospholipid transport system transporter-binding protein